MKSNLTVDERLDLIEKSGCHIAWDGCHKLYLLPDNATVRSALEAEYDVYPAIQIKDLWESSCSLRFINRWGREDGGWDHEWNIEQFEWEKEHPEYEEEEE
jgi:hypothetical protein